MPSKAKQPSSKESRPAGRAKVMTGPHAPLVQLVALLPLVIVYEMAIPFVTIPGSLDSWWQRLLAQIGLTAYFAPGLLILAALLVMHLVRGDKWQVSLDECLKLWGEALLWTVPLVVLCLLFTMPIHKLLGTSLAASTSVGGLFSNIILSIGAGLFEEFLFRLLIMSATLFVLQKVFAVPVSAAQIVAIGVAAAIFSAAHHIVLGSLPFNYVDFLFRAAAGIYLGATFILRGFATATIVHATFNIVLACWAFW